MSIIINFLEELTVEHSYNNQIELSIDDNCNNKEFFLSSNKEVIFISKGFDCYYFMLSRMPSYTTNLCREIVIVDEKQHDLFSLKLLKNGETNELTQQTLNESKKVLNAKFGVKSNNNKENIEEFTCTAMMSAYQKYRLKALDYMLSLDGRHEASLLVKIQTQKMMFEKESFESEKEMKVLLLVCKHFDSTLILNELDNCKNNRVNNNEVIQRHKELSYIVLNSKLSVDKKKEKKIKI